MSETRDARGARDAGEVHAEQVAIAREAVAAAQPAGVVTRPDQRQHA